MAYPYDFIKFTFGGQLAGNNEIWTCGFHIGNSDTDVTAGQFLAFEDDLAALGALVRAYITDTDMRIPSGASVQWIKLALIGKDGKYVREPLEYILPTAGSGGSTSGYVPQASTVVTLVSAKFKDPGKYNRFYLPAAAPNTPGAYRLTAGQIAAMSARSAEFLADVNAITFAIDPLLSIEVVSQNVNMYYSAYAARVGDVLDTQRRRRNKIAENYSDSSI